MAIRLRRIPGVGLIGLCAARSMPQDGDIYLDDDVHMALSRKYWLDYGELGIEVEAEVRAATEAEESNNPNRADWDAAFGLRAALSEEPRNG